MHTGRFVFSELIADLPHQEFQKCVARYDDHPQPRKLSYWDQYLAMALAQLTYRESLRDIEACLRSVTGKLYHLGFRGTVARSTLADANEPRDGRIFAEFAHVLIKTARPLYADEPLGVDLDQSLYALDSTTIDLCLALFPWAKFRKHKAPVKMHTLLDLHGNIPTFIRISDGKLHDVNVLDDIAMEAGAFYVFDRGYLDFARLYRFTLRSQYPHLYSHFRRKTARRERPRRHRHGGRRLLCLRSGLSRFCAALPVHALGGILRHAHERKRRTPTSLLSSRGQEHRSALRPDGRVDHQRVRPSIPGRAAAYQLRRRRNQQPPRVSD